MKYLSVCSGIEAATCAWHDMGWTPVAFSEIEPFPSAVLKHHYPDVPNLGDMTKYKEWNIESIDLLVGGTPCQSFSVAGLRKGLEDPRGNLALTYVGILDKFRPKWFIWENVPGVLSSNGGRDFGSFLGAVAELGYGWSYRVLDAQYFGVAQRRRRVFVVGHLGIWEPAAKVLFESDCLRRDTKKSKKARERTSYPIADSAGTLQARDYKGVNSDDAADGGKLIIYSSDKSPTLTSSAAGISRVGNDATADSQYVVQQAFRKSRRAQSTEDHETWVDDGKANTINTFDLGDIRTTHAIALQGAGATSQSANGSGYKEDQSFTLNTTDVHGVAYAFEPGKLKRLGQVQGPKICTTLRADMGDNQTAVAVGVDVYNQCIDGQVAATMSAAVGGSNTSGPKVMQSMAVRRLTPTECERLQGFKDSYTLIPWKKGESPDGLRYKALGNSMAVSCMKWIGDKINEINQQT